MQSQKGKAELFKKLHEQKGCFIIPNPWDIGSAKLLVNLGFEALATTSAGLAFSLGRPDLSKKLSLDEVLNNARDILSVSDLPVSADLENGYGDTPDDVYRTIIRAGKIGLVGASIEDATGIEEIGVKRISLGSLLAKAAFGEIERAAREVKERHMHFC